MFPRSATAALAAIACASASYAQSNLPPLGPSVFTVRTGIEIDAPLETVWNKVLDFPSYPDWNPFSRSQIVCDEFFIPLQNQSAFEGARLIISVQIPPLTPPVNASTPANPLNAQVSFENITHLQPELHRVAWQQIDIPEFAVNATRWSAVSTVGNVTLYESAEAYSGALAPLVETLFGEGLQEAFDAQGVALKMLLEG